MTYEELKFRAEWFKEQETKLGYAADQLTSIREDIQEISCLLEQKSWFAPLEGALQKMRTSLTYGENGADTGIALLDDLQEGIVVTGREYLRMEAENEGLAQEIEKLIDDLDL